MTDKKDTSIEEIINIKNYETIDSDVTNISLLTSVEPNNNYIKYKPKDADGYDVHFIN